MNADQLLRLYDRVCEAEDAVPRLRRFVLDLAVRGKLVPQDPDDEPASELLKRIEKEKARLGLRRSAGDTVVTDSPFALPAGWIFSSIGEICSKTGSGSTPRGGKEVYRDQGIPFLRSQNVYDDGLRLDDVAYIASDVHERMSGTEVKAADLLLNITGGSMGRCCRIPDDFDTANVSQHVAIIRPVFTEMVDYLHCLVLSPYFQAFIFGEQTGAGRGGLPKNRMDRIAVPLPPLAEQHRIVAKVEELMALLDRIEAARAGREEGRNRLTAATLARLTDPKADAPAAARFALDTLAPLTNRPEQIKTLRQTILNLAVRGKLVEQDPSDEPAAALLERIETERQLKVKDKKIRISQPLLTIRNDELPFDLPSGWAWVRLGNIIQLISGQHLQPSEYSENIEGGLPYITGPSDFSGNGAIVRRAALVRKAVAKRGQLLITVKGSGVGKAMICDLDEVAISRQLMAMEPLGWKIGFLELIADRLAVKLQEEARSLIPGISRDDISEFVTALPPLAEQNRIVAKVDTLMRLLDDLEAALSTSATTRARLLDATLRAALTDTGAAA